MTYEQYTYSSLITQNATNPYLYRDEYDIVYAVMDMKKDDEQWIDLFISADDGETWYTDSKLPIAEEFPLHNPKMFVKNDIYYLFAYGSSSFGSDDIYLIRKFVNVTDKQGNQIDDFWEQSWSRIIFDNHKHCRITDVTTDSVGYFAFISYDKECDSGVYESRLAIYSLTEYAIKMDVPINSNTKINQHNGRLIMINDNTIGVTWEMQIKDVYDGKTYQIAYRQYNLLSKEWTDLLVVSNDKKNNNYHQSITVNSAKTVFITWLNTQTTNENNNVQYFKTNTIQLGTVVDGELASVENITNEAKPNEYPYIVCDEYDNLYVMYNTNNYIQYITKKLNTDNWVSVTNIKESEWRLLVGYCFNNNLYTIAQNNDNTNFIRIDTDMAEVFQPVKDFQIYDINNKEIKFAWTAARNAEDIKLQMLAETQNWNWIKPNTTHEVDANTNEVYIVGLKPNILYALKLIYTTPDKKLHTIIYPKRLIDETSIKDNYHFTWDIPSNAIKQELFIAEELWIDTYDIPNGADNYTIKYSGDTTSFRLNIRGGKAEGYSNEASPLMIDYKDNQYILSWIPFKNVEKVQMEQSIDGINYYPALTTPIKAEDNQCVINHTNKITYFYRMKYVSNGKEKLSNVVTLTNNLQALNIYYNAVDLQWTTTDESEIVKFQFTQDEGENWFTVTNSITNSQSTLRKLNYDDDYWIRLYFPMRFTGKYSNIIKIRTQKHPIEKFTCIQSNKKDKTPIHKGQGIFDEKLETHYNVPYNNVVIRFVVINEFSDINIHCVDMISGNDTVISYNSLSKKLEKQYTETKKELTATLSLNKGIPYNIYVEALNSTYGTSEKINVYTNGDGTPQLKVKTVTKNSCTLDIGSMNNITNNNASKCVRIYISPIINKQHSWNNEEQQLIVSDITQPFVINNLMHSTTYNIRLECLYGDNYGVSETLQITTQDWNYEPIYGDKNVGETSFTYSKKNQLFYIFDSNNGGRLYTYKNQGNTLDDKVNSTEFISYNLSYNHIYSDITCDKNGYVHCVFTCGKYVYYTTNCKENVNGNIVTHNLNDLIVIEHNELVNEYLYPNITMDMDKNILYICWQEDFGTFSSVSMMEYRNGSPLIDSPITMLNNGLHNNIPKIRLTRDNGFKIFAIDSANNLQIVSADVNNNYDSPTYLEYSFKTDTLALDNPYTDAYNDYDVWIDNLNGVRIVYDSYNGTQRTSTYATYLQDSNGKYKFNIESVFHNRLYSSVILAYDEMILLGKSEDKKLYSSKYVAKENQFSDLNEMNLSVSDSPIYSSEIYKEPLYAIGDKDNVYILENKDGRFYIYSVLVSDIIAKNNFVSDKWIGNQFAIENSVLSVVAEIWSNGDTMNYPQLFIKVNNMVKEITPFDEYGLRSEQNITVDSFEEIDKNDSAVHDYVNKDTKMIVKILYNTNKTLYIDVTDMLYYVWDESTIINKASH